MFLLLLAACLVYSILGEITEGITMLVAVVFVISIDFIQNYRSRRAVNALGKLTAAKSKVIRNREVLEIPSDQLVIDDILLCDEGMVIPADGVIIASSDLTINESVLTGESVSVFKVSGDLISQGTMITGGYCFAKVNAIGRNTTLASISKLVKDTGQAKTPLQLKVHQFTKNMVLFGGVGFLFVWFYHYLDSGSIMHGLLHGLAMAMSVLPEELPVALSTFMAIGAYRLYKIGVVAKSPQTVETLGSANVLCVDKTGTITQNLMILAHVFDYSTNKEFDFQIQGGNSEALEFAMWASEITPFDPMEKSIHEHYGKLAELDKRPEYRMIKEYPLAGSPPTMTHVLANSDGNRLIACKGALEGVVTLCKLERSEAEKILTLGKSYAKRGYRVLGIAKGDERQESLPETQAEIEFKFLGLITFYDPPVANISQVIRRFAEIGVRIVMITGDYAETGEAIAKLAGINSDVIITGIELEKMTEEELLANVRECSIFARISPHQKLRIVEALKSSGKIVAMTGDGVNDAPALKAAHIGISMGKKGTEVARESSGLVLSTDDLSKIEDAIFLGRSMNINLKKAFRYIISIHIPIILLVSMPIFFGWLPSMLFAPLHVIFLELIMGPTCSILFENEKISKTNLLRPLDAKSKNLLNFSELSIAIIQGVVVTLGCILAGFVAFQLGLEYESIRSYVFYTLIFANIFLTLSNRSYNENFFDSMKQPNKFVPFVVFVPILFLLLINYLSFINDLFMLEKVSLIEICVLFGVGLLFSLWIEIFKFNSKPKALALE